MFNFLGFEVWFSFLDYFGYVWLGEFTGLLLRNFLWNQSSRHNFKLSLNVFRYGTLKRVRGTLKMVVWYFEEGDVVLWKGLYGTLKRVVWYFEKGCMVLWRGWCGTLKRVVWYFEEGAWYFEEGGMVLWRGWCGTLKRVVWYFEECGMVLWKGLYGTLKMVVWYFEEGLWIWTQQIANYNYIWI